MSLKDIFKETGIHANHYEAVQGGDINRAYCLYSGEQKYFLKINDAEKYPGMFKKEARGLEALKANSSIDVPRIISSGSISGQQYLVLEWVENGAPGGRFWQEFGAALATLHLQPQPYFGWPENNFIGSLVQLNKQHNDWDLFYTECRIMPLVKKLFDAATFSKTDLKLTDSFCKKISGLFPAETPSLLHGDLWSGNFMVNFNGKASIFDPAVYYGHREMDLGMTRLFGGFEKAFYEAYDSAYPLEKGWRQRLPFTQLYPLLVHAVLFGGHYVGRVKQILSH